MFKVVDGVAVVVVVISRSIIEYSNQKRFKNEVEFVVAVGG